MKLLKIYDRSKNLLQNLEDFDYTSIQENEINEITGIKGNPEDFLEKIIEVWDYDKPLFGGIAKRYTYNKENNTFNLFIYPYIVDLYQDFITDPLLSDPGDKIYYINDSIENILQEILDQYIAKIDTPILSKGTFATTGKNVIFTFKYNSLFEALQFLIKKMLLKGFFVEVDYQGKVNLVNYTNTVDLKYKEDIKKITYTKRTDEKVKTVIFDNKRAGSEHIYKSYNNPGIITGKVKYISDSRFQDETSVDNYIEAYLAENTDKIEVENIISEIDVPLYSKVNIYNWEKNFLELYVVGKSFLNNGTYNLKLGNDVKYKDSDLDITEIINENSDLTIEQINDAVPEYIQETYIDSVEVRSPTIAGNTGLFSDIFKVGIDGIVINGTEKSIRSGAYDEPNKSGWKIWNNGNFLFGGNTNNYIEWDGSNFNISGKISAKTGSSINFDYVDGTNKPANNATVGADWNSNLSNIPDSATASYIKSTYIDQTTIQSPYIAGTSGYFSGTFKVGSSGIIIDGVNKNIRSSNFVSGSSGWKIENNGNVEFQDGTFRGTIEATSGSLTGGFTIEYPGYIDIYENANNKLLMGILSGRPAFQFLDNGVLVSELIGEQNKYVSIGGSSYYLDCLSVSDDLYVGRDLIIGDDLIVTDDFYLGGQVVSDLSFGGSADIVFTSTSNRIYGESSKTYYLYFNGSYWYVKDVDGTHQL